MPFVATIEAAAGDALADAPGWDDDPVDARVAKLILFDQLTRNCFRGTPRAFAYDDKALALARRMAADDDLVNTLPPAVRGWRGRGAGGGKHSQS